MRKDQHWKLPHVVGYGGVVYDRSEWLRMLRRSTGLTTEEIATRSGINPRQLSYFLSHPPESPTFSVIRRLASVLGEGVWAAFGFEPIGWRRGRVRTEITYLEPEQVKRVVVCEVCHRVVESPTSSQRVHDGFCRRVSRAAAQHRRYWAKREAARA